MNSIRNTANLFNNHCTLALQTDRLSLHQISHSSFSKESAYDKLTLCCQNNENIVRKNIINKIDFRSLRFTHLSNDIKRKL